MESYSIEPVMLISSLGEIFKNILKCINLYVVKFRAPCFQGKPLATEHLPRPWKFIFLHTVMFNSSSVLHGASYLCRSITNVTPQTSDPHGKHT